MNFVELASLRRTSDTSRGGAALNRGRPTGVERDQERERESERERERERDCHVLSLVRSLRLAFLTMDCPYTIITIIFNSEQCMHYYI